MTSARPWRIRAPAGLGRADLIRAWSAAGEKGLTITARLLGYAEQVEEEREAAARPPRARAGPDEPARPAFVPIGFWQLQAVEHEEDIELGVERRPPTEARYWSRTEPPAADRAPPAPVPIVARARLWPPLDRTLRSTHERRDIDVDRLVSAWSRGEVIHRVPRVRATALTRRLVLLIDRSERLIPFFADQRRVADLLRDRLGKAGVREVVFHEGYPLPWDDGENGPFERPPVRTGDRVLALTDLGFYGDRASRACWLGLGRDFRAQAIPLTALLLCPASRWSPDLARLWNAIDWSDPMHARFGGVPPDPAALRERAERLLRLAAPAIRFEPGLLRDLRRLLPRSRADLGTEADVWAHPGVDGRLVDAAIPSTEMLRSWRAAFADDAGVTRDQKRRAVGVVRRWHAPLPPEVWLEEVLFLALAGRLPAGALRGEEVAAARAMLHHVAHTLRRPRGSTWDEAVKEWFRDVGLRVGDAIWRDPELRRPFRRAWRAAYRGEEAPLPAGMGPGLMAEGNEEVHDWVLRHVEDRLEMRPGEAVSKLSGSPVATFSAGSRHFAVAERRDGSSKRFSLDEPIFVGGCESPALIVRTDRTVASLRRITRPPWANAGMGRDRFGLWSAFEVEGVVQRLRWIPPGRFWMGSPDEEPGRFEEEGPRHRETIDRGFWLADTPCTQALWKAVTGDNPSRFQSPDRPAEQVSFEDVAAFLDALGERVSGLRARLPNEAEWEYACRGGTDTATYAGPIELLGLHDVPVVDPIAWYGGNSGAGFELDEGEDSSGWREKQYPHETAGTRAVASKDPNPWGLFDMLGNVHEWCDDLWSSGYDSPREGPDRVVRGGSWYSFARYLRAAYRYHARPDLRWHSLGLRLARGRGQESSGA